jgi:hypothetical protein
MVDPSRVPSPEPVRSPGPPGSTLDGLLHGVGLEWVLRGWAVSLCLWMGGDGVAGLPGLPGPLDAAGSLLGAAGGLLCVASGFVSIRVWMLRAR